MDRDGFTLVELIVVVAIVGILLAIVTPNFQDYTKRSNIDGQTKMLFADLQEARGRSLFERKTVSVALTSNVLKVYSSATVSVTPLIQKTLKHPVTLTNSALITFESGGICNSATPASDQLICVQTENSAAYDSIIISPTRIKMGKRNPGGACASASVQAK
jgi:prepilin-type N-terminal cleavage/methylation domain-containing protein